MNTCNYKWTICLMTTWRVIVSLMPPLSVFFNHRCSLLVCSNRGSRLFFPLNPIVQLLGIWWLPCLPSLPESQVCWSAHCGLPGCQVLDLCTYFFNIRSLYVNIFYCITQITLFFTECVLTECTFCAIWLFLQHVSAARSHEHASFQIEEDADTNDPGARIQGWLDEGVEQLDGPDGTERYKMIHLNIIFYLQLCGLLYWLCISLIVLIVFSRGTCKPCLQVLNDKSVC